MKFSTFFEGKKKINILMTDTAMSFGTTVVYSYLAYQDQMVKELGAEPPSTKKIIKATGLSENAVESAIQELRSGGLIDADGDMVVPPKGSFRPKKKINPEHHWHHHYQFWTMPVRKPNETVSHIQWALLMFLYHCSDTRYRPLKNTASYLARVLHAGRTTIIDSIEKLQQTGFLKVTRQNDEYNCTLNTGPQAMALVMSLAQDEVKHPENEAVEVITTAEWDIIDTRPQPKPPPTRYTLCSGSNNKEYRTVSSLPTNSCICLIGMSVTTISGSNIAGNFQHVLHPARTTYWPDSLESRSTSSLRKLSRPNRRRQSRLFSKRPWNWRIGFGNWMKRATDARYQRNETIHSLAMMTLTGRAKRAAGPRT